MTIWMILLRLHFMLHMYLTISMRILHNDFESDWNTLFRKFSSQYVNLTPCLHDIFVLKEVSYDLRTPKLEQPIRRTTTHGLRTFFFYLGSKLWNEFLSDFNYTSDTDFDELKKFLKHWEGPSVDPTYRNYVWTLLADLLFGVDVLHVWYFICFEFLYTYYLDSIIFLSARYEFALYILPHFFKIANLPVG